MIALFAALVATPSFVLADYTNFYFNSSNGCPDLGISCYAPTSMCAYDSVNDKYYCCSGESYDICRAFAPSCGGSDGGPSSSQQECTSGSSSWCCLSESERCTSRTGQINICVATSDNPIADVPDLLMNQTYSSLSSANPSATTYSVDVAALAVRATASSTSSSTSTSSTTATATPSETSSNDSGSSTPVGAIAGGVVGGVVGLAAIAALVWFVLRRRKQSNAAESTPLSPTGGKAEKNDPFGGPSPGLSTPAPQYQLAEMEGTREVNELGGDVNHKQGYHAAELPTGPHEARELPG